MFNRIHPPRLFLAFALTLALAVSSAAPAVGKGPVLYPATCMAGDATIRAECLREPQRPDLSGQDDGALDGGLVAGIVVVVGLLLVGGMTAATQRSAAGGASQADLRGRFS